MHGSLRDTAELCLLCLLLCMHNKKSVRFLFVLLRFSGIFAEAKEVSQHLCPYDTAMTAQKTPKGTLHSPKLLEKSFILLINIKVWET